MNLGVFVMMTILAKTNPDLANQIDFYGAISRDYFHIWQPISSAFLHAGFLHIFGNMLFLLAFGPSVEDRLGRIGFSIFYLAGGAVSGFAHIALSDHPAIGASGAIAAVAGAFLVLFPSTRIKCFVIFFIIGVFMIPAWWLIGLFIILDLGAQIFTPANGIANMAHLGGYAFGAAVALTLLVTGILPKEPYDMFSLAKHRKRRADFRVAHEMHKLAGVYQADQELDPKTAKIADLRAKIGVLLSQPDLPAAAALYLDMLKEFPDHSKALTLHRDAQYQLANHFYQSGNRQAAGDAFARLLDTYPNDPERHIITILLARIRAHDLDDPIGAIELLEDLADKIHDTDTKALIDNELAAIQTIPR
jgi:membrane associated rhomboid family serine protease